MAVIDLHSPLFYPERLNVAFSGVGKLLDLVLLHKQKHAPRYASVIHHMAVTADNPALEEAVDLLAMIA